MCWFINLEISTIQNVKNFDWRPMLNQITEFQLTGEYPTLRIEKNGCLCEVIEKESELQKLRALLRIISNQREVKSLKLTKYWSELKSIKRVLNTDISNLKNVLNPGLEEDVTIKITNQGKFLTLNS